jgi:hypothetical protein
VKFTSLFYKRSVASITASLSSMVKDLEDHAETKMAEVAKHADAAKTYQDLAQAASDEVAKAKAASLKIAALFS